MSFGSKCRTEFLLDPDHHFTNHGATGTIPTVVFNKRAEILEQQETNPDYWFRCYSRPLWQENVEVAAKFIGAEPDNLALIPNTTTGINNVVKSIPFTANDAILVNTWTFSATRNICHAAITKAGGQLWDVHMSIPIHDTGDVIDKYRVMLSRHPNIKLVVLDVISCPTAFLWPLTELVALCKEHNALVLIDGAHAPGQVALQVEEMGEAGVDFFVGTFHKWAFTPRACDVLWRHPRHNALVHPVITSYICSSPHEYTSPSLHDTFYQQGTSDRSTFFTMKDAVGYYNSKGGLGAIVSHNVSLVDRAVSLLLDKWGTRRFPVPADMEAPFMRLVRVPDLPSHPVPDEFKTVPYSHTSLMVELSENYRVSCLINFVDGEPWVRISAQIYNTMEDYEALADAVLDIKRRGEMEGETKRLMENY